MKPYELIIFDWDGTLMDSENKIIRCFEKSAADVGVDFPGDDAVRNIIGLGLKESLDVLVPEEDQSIRNRLVERYRVHFLEKDTTEMPLFEGVEAGLDGLLGLGYKLAIATGKARVGLARVLDETGLEDRFVTTRCSDEAKSKPHPHMVHDILNETGVDAGSAIVVGDTVYDIQMAHSADTDALAVCYGVHERERLLAEGPVDCVGDFAAVIEWFTKPKHPPFPTS
jgi:phosphoglycolate phosphatase